MPLKITWRNGFAYLSGTVNGQRIRKSLGTSDPRSAEEERAAQEAKLRRIALYGPEAEATFGDAVLEWRKLGKKERGNSKIADLLIPIVKSIGKYKLRDIKPAMVKTLAKRLYPDVKPQTLNRYVLVPVSAVINNAHEHGLCHPIKIKRFKAEDARKRVAVDRAWIDRFRVAALEHYSDDYEGLGQRIGAYALFMFTTAARPIEAVALTRECFSFADRVGRSRYPTKNGEYREYYLTEEVAAELASLPAVSIAKGRHAGELRLFGWSEVHGPLPAWKAVCKAARLPYRSPYEAGRHSFATEAVTRQERNVKTSAAVGGWADAGVMLKHYAKAEGQAEFAEEVFGSKKGKAK